MQYMYIICHIKENVFQPVENGQKPSVTINYADITTESNINIAG